MKVLAIANQKGGVAKSITSVNLAALLAMKGFKTLLIDVDAQANSSQNLDLMQFDHGAAELFESPKTKFVDVINETSIDNLSIIPSDLSLGQVEWDLLMSFKPSHLTILRDKLRAAKADMFDYVVIDCPPSLGLFTMNALHVADRVLIPVALDPFALIGTKYLWSTINEIRMSTNKQLKIIGIVRTKWDMRKKNLASGSTMSLEADYPGKLMKTIIRDSVRVQESVLAQIPIVAYEPTAPVSQQHTELLEEVLNQW